MIHYHYIFFTYQNISGLSRFRTQNPIQKLYRASTSYLNLGEFDGKHSMGARGLVIEASGSHRPLFVPQYQP